MVRPSIRATQIALICVTAVFSLLPPTSASGAASPIFPEVAKAIAAMTSAKPPHTYAAMREVWRLWDRADPVHVEEAIVALAERKDLDPAARVYAELLSAYARRRRGDARGASDKIKNLGFLGSWITLGPFDNKGRSGFDVAYAPEQELGQPLSTTRPYQGKERPVRWRAPAELSSYGWVDFGAGMRPRTGICAYATTFIRDKTASKKRTISIWAGAGGAFRMWWNGEKVLEDSGYRDLDIDRYAALVDLVPGNNRITVKVCSTDSDTPSIAVRIGDEKGAPAKGIDVIADPTLTAVAVKEAKDTKDTKDAKPATQSAPKIEGPMQMFKRLLGPLAGASEPKGKDGKPAKEPTEAEAVLLEAFARYLVATGGDEPTEHLARILAGRAADAHPTVARLLLAGELAEDRNQRRARVDKAAEISADPDKDVEILLARAHLARTGANWRDAVPLYEKLLARDPDHIRAMLGFVELYVEAGLPRTAISILEKALQKNPQSVALLRVYAGQLRSLGRDTEAAETEQRYSALRFDDTSFVGDQVDLAVNRRDIAGAERWIQRFMDVETDPSRAHAFAARSFRSLGKADRALAEYQAALAAAPEDVSTMRAVSDLYAEMGKRDEQMKMLRDILVIVPQAKGIREYLEHIEPPKPRPDEAYAWAPEVFLPMRAIADKRYPKKTLRNLTVTTVYPNGLASRFHQVVYVPLTEEAAQDGRDYGFAYQGDSQIVTLRAARVFKKDGKIEDAVETGESGVNNPAISMYTSTRVFHVRFPRLSPGDVVELRYRIEDVSVRNEVADYFGDIEYLQSDEPIASSEYLLLAPKSKKLYTYATPIPGLVKETKDLGEQTLYRFAATDVAPLTPEPAMPPWSELLAQVHVSTMKDWEEVASTYWGLAKDQFDVDDVVRQKVRELTKGLTDNTAKVRAIYRFVTELRYVALELGIEGIRPRRAAQTMARGWGDCKDKATLIVTMLRELSIPATIVLVRTQMRGGIDESVASLAPFDHAIAYVPSLDLYLDGTAEHTGSTELPSMDRGAFALQVNEGKAKLVRLPNAPAADSKIVRKVELTLAADGSTQIASDTTVTGAFAPEWRNRYLADGTRNDRLQRDLSGDFGPIEIPTAKGSVEVNDLNDEETSVRIKVKAKAPSLARKEGESLSVPSGSVENMAADMASLSTRTLPVVVGALRTTEDEWTVKLPAGLRATRVPVAMERDTPFGSFSVKVEQPAGKVVVRTSLVIKKSRVSPSEYQDFRVFCESVDRAFGQRVVVGK